MTRHLLTAECSEVAREGFWWQDHLALVLSTKPAGVIQEVIQVLEKHGRPVKEELKSESYYSSTLLQVIFQVLHYANVIRVTFALREWDNYHNRPKALTARLTAQLFRELKKG